MNTSNFFNKEIKDRFLLSCENSHSKQQIATISLTLKKISEYENKHSIDVAQLPPEEVYHALFSDDYPFEGSARKQFAVISEYKMWCKENNVIGAVNIDQLRYPDIQESIFVSNMEKHFYTSPQDMLNDLLEIYSFSNGHPQVPFCCLLWEGLSVVDIAELKDEQVNLYNGRIYDKDHNVIVEKIDDKILEVLRVFKETKIGTRLKPVPWSEAPHPHPVYPVCNGYFITPFRRQISDMSPLNTPGIRKELDKTQKEYFERSGKELRLNSKYIALSGRLYRLWKMETSGINLYSLTAEDIKKIFGQTFNAVQVLKQYNCYKYFKMTHAYK